MSELNTDKLISLYIKKEISLSEVELYDARQDLLCDYKALREYHNYALQMQDTVKELEQRVDTLTSSALYKACGVFRVLKRTFGKKCVVNKKADTPLPPLTFDAPKKQILFFDSYVPSPDKDAGSRSIFNYLQILTQMGFEIKFLSDSFLPADKYSNALEQMGVSVLNHNYYGDNWQEFIAKNAEKFDFFVFNRPLCASKYMDFVKKYSTKKCVYIGCDLHFLREQREYELLPTPQKLKSISRIKLKEFLVMSKADNVIMYNHFEKEVIKQEFNLDNVTVAPLYCINTPVKKRKPFFQTKDVLFVGGFAHAPNVDGVLWFYSNIWQKLNLKDAKFIVVGANPPEDIKNLPDIEIKGFVNDDELFSLYENCRVCVVPLRFGAGIKGKLVEAMGHGIPIVSTSVAMEGITDISLCPADTPKDFAMQLIEKYTIEQNTDYNKCLEENFSQEKLETILKTIFS